jgi:hypothetical protein
MPNRTKCIRLVSVVAGNRVEALAMRLARNTADRGSSGCVISDGPARELNGRWRRCLHRISASVGEAIVPTCMPAGDRPQDAHPPKRATASTPSTAGQGAEAGRSPNTAAAVLEAGSRAGAQDDHLMCGAPRPPATVQPQRMPKGVSCGGRGQKRRWSGLGQPAVPAGEDDEAAAATVSFGTQGAAGEAASA